MMFKLILILISALTLSVSTSQIHAEDSMAEVKGALEALGQACFEKAYNGAREAALPLMERASTDQAKQSATDFMNSMRDDLFVSCLEISAMKLNQAAASIKGQ